MSNLRSIKHWTAIILTCCFLFVSAGLSYSPVTHLHFGHHDQQSHGKILCSWTCQAANALQGFSPILPTPFSRLWSIHLPHPPVPDLDLFFDTASRAPPPSALL
ncbi:MAG: hypothetical protein AB7T38_11580 [Nitrospirales bacterium]